MLQFLWCIDAHQAFPSCEADVMQQVGQLRSDGESLGIPVAWWSDTRVRSHGRCLPGGWWWWMMAGGERARWGWLMMIDDLLSDSWWVNLGDCEGWEKCRLIMTVMMLDDGQWLLITFCTKNTCEGNKYSYNRGYVQRHSNQATKFVVIYDIFNSILYLHYPLLTVIDHPYCNPHSPSLPFMNLHYLSLATINHHHSRSWTALLLFHVVALVDMIASVGKCWVTIRMTFDIQWRRCAVLSRSRIMLNYQSKLKIKMKPFAIIDRKK